MTAILMSIAVIVFTTSGLFQIARMRRTGSARDVSFWYVTFMTIGVMATWGMVMLDDASTFVRVERTLNVIAMFAVEISVIYYKRKDRRHES